jgi:hypothetical protein
MRTMPTRSVIAAIIFIRPSHAGHFSASTPCLHCRRAQSMRSRFVSAARRRPTARSVAVASAPSPPSAAPMPNPAALSAWDSE